MTYFNRDETSLIGLKSDNGSEVIQYIKHWDNGHSVWLVRCVCNNKFKMRRHRIVDQRYPEWLCTICTKDKISKIRSSDIKMIDQTFGYWSVLKKTEQTKDRVYKYLCQCKCGTLREVSGTLLRSGQSKSCGCVNKERLKNYCGEKHHNWNSKLTDKKRIRRKKRYIRDKMINRKFGRLFVINRIKKENISGVYYGCLCDCGKKRVVRSDGLRSGRAKSCGCLNKEILRSRYGPKNPSWNKNLTDEDRQKKRNEKRLFVLRHQVFKRDDYTCKKCKKTSSGDLIMHHLNGFHWCVNGRYDINNCVTLCEKCHKMFHHIYGVKNVTREMFQEFYPGVN